MWIDTIVLRIGGISTTLGGSVLTLKRKLLSPPGGCGVGDWWVPRLTGEDVLCELMMGPPFLCSHQIGQKSKKTDRPIVKPL
jgi:hypothetical protein